MQLILASASPRRKQLLAQLGVSFRIQQADIDETPKTAEPAQAYVERLALEKAQVVYKALQPEKVAVLGSDTSVVLDGQIFGKPENEHEAKTMLAQLAGQTHEVMTSIALVHSEAKTVQTQISRVRFAPLSEAEIAAYIASKEPFGKAGAYAIQGYAGAFIAHLEGSYSGVMGLPLYETRQLLNTLKDTTPCYPLVS